MIFILIMLEDLGQEEFKGKFNLCLEDVFYCMKSSMESIPNVFRYVYQQLFRMPELWREEANNNNKN